MDKTKNENALAGLQPLRDRLDMVTQRFSDDGDRLFAAEQARRALSVAEAWAQAAFSGTFVRSEEHIAAEGEENGPQESESTPQDGDGEVSGESDGGAAPELDPERIPREHGGAPEPVSEESSEAGAGEERPE